MFLKIEFLQPHITKHTKKKKKKNDNNKMKDYWYAQHTHATHNYVK